MTKTEALIFGWALLGLVVFTIAVARRNGR